jgi:LacI family transcriptional regulator
MFPLLKNSFPWANFASAAIQMLDQPRLHCSASHHLRIMADCISELRSLGYQRIGLYLEQETDALMYHAWSGYLLAYQRTVALGHRVDPLLVKTWEPKKFGAWLRSSKPDVVLTIHLEALGWIHQAGYDVPGDIAFVHLDHHAEFGDCAGMDQQHPLVGAAAVDLVSAQLNRNERGIPLNAKILSVVGRWVNGRTVRPLS